jgi:hypothetical protein
VIAASQNSAATAAPMQTWTTWIGSDQCPNNPDVHHLAQVVVQSIASASPPEVAGGYDGPVETCRWCQGRVAS